MGTDQRIGMLQEKMIGIFGLIELYQGKPEIEVTAPYQIKGLDPNLCSDWPEVEKTGNRLSFTKSSTPNGFFAPIPKKGVTNPSLNYVYFARLSVPNLAGLDLNCGIGTADA
jgi:hypothetical protein